MPDLQGNGAKSEHEFGGLSELQPRGTRVRSSNVWSTLVTFVVVILEVIAQSHVIASSCSYLGYYIDHMPAPPVALQCLKLTADLTPKICNKQIKARQKMMRSYNIRLHFCSSYSLYSVISGSDKANPCRIDGSISECSDCLDRLIAIDNTIAESIAGFSDLLNRMNCNSRYSVKWNCTHCQIAYKEWLCATELSYYHRHMDRPVPPCGDFCSRVEEMCPFFPPDNDDTHAGDPSFICKDPEIGSQSSIYGQKPACYDLCHLVANVDQLFHPTDCHKIDLSSNKNLTVSNATNATSSAHTMHTFSQSGHVIRHLCFAWTLWTVLQHISIGLT